ncbi:MAG: EAL domain-containing protein [Usitatibacteraceae bacterium]
MSWLSPNFVFAFFARTESGERPSEHHAVRRTKIPRVFRRVSPYLAGGCGLVLVLAMLVTMHLASPEMHWEVFLSGVLCACVLSLASRSLRAEWLIGRRTAQLSRARSDLEDALFKRQRAEEDLACIARNTVHLHESLPATLVYIDDRREIQYHNRAFRDGLGSTVSKIDGRQFHEVVGATVYEELEGDLANAFGGMVVHRERACESAQEGSARMLLQYLPQSNDTGRITGVFLVATDLPLVQTAALSIPFATRILAADVPVDDAPRECFAVAASAPEERAGDERHGASGAHDAYEQQDARDQRDGQNENHDNGSDELRLRNAMLHNEFYLYFQTIERVLDNSASIPFREILLRLKVEEENMIPPGSFLPVAEEHGMLPELDRWVVRHLLCWLDEELTRQRAVYSVNIAAQTLDDEEFPSFVKQVLREFGLSGELLCFELQEADVLDRSADARRFVEQLKSVGCRFALCGVSGDRASFDLLRQVPVDFLKIDSSLILNIRRSAVDLARVKAISRVARGVGISTIAECVEDDATLEQLRSIGVDYVQGFGISLPQDLAQIPTSPPDIVPISAAMSRHEEATRVTAA